MTVSGTDSYSLRVSKGVVEAIIRFAALEVPGVVSLAEPGSGLRRLMTGRAGEQGVKLLVKDGVASIELFLVLERGVKLREVSSRVQAAVHEAVTNLVGMPVREVNVHVQDVQ